MNTCPVYYTFVDEDEISPEPVELEEDSPCDCRCNCGYLQYESLIPYLPEIEKEAIRDEDRAKKLEIKLRQQIVEVSRLFDNAVGVKPGFFSKSHIRIKTLRANGRYIRVPPHVEGTLEVFTTDNYQIAPTAFGIQSDFLVYLPCTNHSSRGCTTGCGEVRRRYAVEWSDCSYKVRARWGFDCADAAVQMAVREYIIQAYRMNDPVVVAQTGLQTLRGFKKPDSWNIQVDFYKRKRAIYSRYAIA